MDDGAEASREYERLRAELADFVLNALAERIAAGEEPRLSEALVEAIEKRVDAAVEERLARSQLPDPDTFADEVLAAAARRGGGDDRPAASAGRARAGDSRGRSGGSTKASARPSRLTNFQILLFALIGIAVVAVITIFVLRNMSGTGTTTMVKNEQTNQFVPQQPNGQQPVDPANTATSVGAVTNVQGGTR
jgi:hypothetical protein